MGTQEHTELSALKPLTLRKHFVSPFPDTSPRLYSLLDRVPFLVVSVEYVTLILSKIQYKVT
jgi:hypothetical protein